MRPHSRPGPSDLVASALVSEAGDRHVPRRQNWKVGL